MAWPGQSQPYSGAGRQRIFGCRSDRFTQQGEDNRETNPLQPAHGNLGGRKRGWLAADTEARSLEQGLDLLTCDPGEVARDRMLDGAGRDAVIEALLQILVEQSVDQP